MAYGITPANSQQPPRGVPGAPYRVDITPGWRDVSRLLIGGLFALSIGLGTLIALVQGAAEEHKTVAILLGSIMTLIGLGILAATPKALRRRALVFSAEGLEVIDPKGLPLALRWADVEWVGIKFGRIQRVGIASLFGSGAPLAAIEYNIRPGADQLYPGLRAYKRADHYRFPLGFRADLMQAIAEGFARHVPQAFRGVRDEGTVMSMNYI